MGKRKVYAKTDLSVPPVEHIRDTTGNVVLLPDTIPPKSTTIELGRNTTNIRRFDFSHWYGAGIDSITYACQLQIERFLAGQDRTVTPGTVCVMA